MAKEKTFFSSFLSNFYKKDVEIQELKEKISNIKDELLDQDSYDVKFIEAEASTFGPGGLAHFSGIDQVVDVAALQKIYATETWVYGCVSAISDVVASLPLKLEKRKEYKTIIYNPLSGEKEQVSKEVWEQANAEKLGKLFRHPNVYSSRSEFLNLITIDLLTTGDYYIYLDSDHDLSAIATLNETRSDDTSDPWDKLRTALSANTHIDGMYRIPPAMIKAVPDTKSNTLTGYVLQTEKGSCVLHPSEVIHVRLPNPNDLWTGLSPMIPAFKSVLLDRFSTEHMIRFYKSGARLGGIIETDKALNKEQLGRFQRTFDANYTGRHNHHRTLILQPGMSYRQIEQNPAETQLLEFCRYNREAIMAAYRVPPIKLGIMENSNYANARVQLKLFFTQTVKKYLEFIQEGFNNHPAVLLDPINYRVQFDLSNVEELQEDLSEKAKAASEMLQAGATVDEVREAIWKKGPISGGDKSPVVVDMQAKERSSDFASISTTNELDNKSATSSQPVTSNMSGSQVQAMLSIVQQVTEGKLPKHTAAELLVASFGISRDTANSILEQINTQQSHPSLDTGDKVEAKVALPDVQADTAVLSDVTPTSCTFSERVSQLVQAYVDGGIPLHVAVQQAIQKAKLEGFTDPDDDGNGPGGKKPKEEDKDLGTQPGEQGAEWTHTNIGTEPLKDPKAVVNDSCNCPDKENCTCNTNKTGDQTFEDFLAEEVAKLPKGTEITEEMFQELKNRYESERSKEELLPTKKEVKYPKGFSRDSVAKSWSSFNEKSSPIISSRNDELKKYFSKFKSLVLNKFGGNIKTYGVHKARDSQDAEEILNDKEYNDLLKIYVSEVDKSLQEAMELGYKDTLAKFDFGPTSKQASEKLKQYALRSAKFVNETTKEQIKALLTDMFEQGASVADIGKAINEKFDEISAGRASTIARTETLTAVSLGKDEKRKEWQDRFPDAKLMKMWVTAKDDRVRDSHEELEGVSVEANEEFPNGLKFPRDPSGEPEDIINCRCDVIDFTEEDKETIEQTLQGEQE